MIHRAGECRVEVREKMRGGDGHVTITHFFDEANDLRSGLRLCAKLELEAGSSIGFHRHENEEEMFVVLAGRAEIDDDGTKVAVQAGDTILTGNAGHAVRNPGPDKLVLLAVIAPFAAK